MGRQGDNAAGMVYRIAYEILKNTEKPVPIGFDLWKLLSDRDRKLATGADC